MHVGYYTSDKKRCYSYFLDSHKEFDRNRTDHIHHKKINIEHRLYHFMDAPGERSMIPNTIMGIAQADAAVLVLDGETDEVFELEFDQAGRGQAKEHILIAATMGVKQLIVVVNKVETSLDLQRYVWMEAIIKDCVKKVGFNPASVSILPISSYHAHNLFEHERDT